MNLTLSSYSHLKGKMDEKEIKVMQGLVSEVCKGKDPNNKRV